MTTVQDDGVCLRLPVIIPSNDLNEIRLKVNNLFPTLWKKYFGAVDPVFMPTGSPNISVEPRS